MSTSEPAETIAEQEFSIVIVGGGPQGLAVLSALHEWYSYAEWNDTDYKFRMGKEKKFKKVGTVCVVDPGDIFLEQWDRQFKALGITFLRSPMFAHPDAYDEEALLVYATKHQRHDEIHSAPLAHAGKGRQSKNKREVGRSVTGIEGHPSSALFSDFCRNLGKRLDHTWVKGTAVDIDKTDKKYVVTVDKDTSNKSKGIKSCIKLKCDAVVMATGSCGKPNIPPPFCLRESPSSIIHTAELFSKNQNATLAELVRQKVSECTSRTGNSNVLVIGGGLCAAQATIEAHRAGAVVTMRSRRKLMTKDYDLAREWLEFRATHRLRYEFLSKPIDERPQALAEAVDGGSVPQIYISELERLSQSGSSLTIEVDTTIDSTSVTVSENGIVNVGEDEQYALVILATGTQLTPLSNDLFIKLNKSYPAKFQGALPILTSSLRWVPEEKIYVVGAVGAIEIGPGALNLMGAKRSGQLVADDLQDLMYTKPDIAKIDKKQKMLSNGFALLQIHSDSDSDESTSEEED